MALVGERQAVDVGGPGRAVNWGTQSTCIDPFDMPLVVDISMAIKRASQHQQSNNKESVCESDKLTFQHGGLVQSLHAVPVHLQVYVEAHVCTRGRDWQ